MEFFADRKKIIIFLLTNPWIVFTLAIGVRLAIVSQGYSGDPQDTPEYDEIARNLLSGNGFVASEWWHGIELRAWRAPFYPFFLAGVYGIFGENHAAVRIIQCAVGAMTAVLVMRLGRKIDARIAPICSGLAIVYGPLAAVSNEVMSETWFAFHLVMGAYCLTPPAGVRAWTGGGIALGLAILTRPVGVALGLALGLVALVDRNYRRLLWTGGIALLVLLPWTLRNHAVFGTWPVLSTQGGFIMAHSNALDPDWRKPHGWGVPRDFLEAVPSEIDRDRIWRQQAVQFVRDHPDMYVRLAIARFLHFWYFFHPAYNIWFMCVLPFFLYGFYRFWRVNGYVLPALLIGISIALFSFVLYGNARFRLPLEPFFLIFAGAAIGHLRKMRGWQCTVGLIGGVVLLNVWIAWQEVPIRNGLLTVLQAWGLK